MPKEMYTGLYGRAWTIHHMYTCSSLPKSQSIRKSCNQLSLRNSVILNKHDDESMLNLNIGLALQTTDQD